MILVMTFVLYANIAWGHAVFVPILKQATAMVGATSCSYVEYTVSVDICHLR